MIATNEAVSLNYVRKRNVNVILDLLFKKSYSGLELSEITALSPAAISKILKQLLSLGLIEKEKRMIDKKTVGGQHIRYKISGQSGLLICVDFTHFTDLAVITDFSGKELFRKKYTLSQMPRQIIKEDLLYIINDIKKEVEEIGLPVYCVSICAPGQINQETNSFIISGKFNELKGDFVYRSFSEAFNSMVILRNNVQMMAVGEYAYGALKSKYNTAIYIYAGFGLASCSLYKGEIISGWKGYSGEIGGNRYNVDSTLSLNASLGRLMDRYIDHLEDRSINSLIKAFKTNDYVRKGILESSKILAADIVNMTNLIGANIVVISGESLEFGEEYLNSIKEYLDKYCVPDMEVYPARVKDSALKGGLELGRTFTVRNILDLKFNNSIENTN